MFESSMAFTTGNSDYLVPSHSFDSVSVWEGGSDGTGLRVGGKRRHRLKFQDAFFSHEVQEMGL